MENGNDSGDGPAAGVSNDHLLSSTPQTDLAEMFTDNPCKRDFSLKKKELYLNLITVQIRFRPQLLLPPFMIT